MIVSVLLLIKLIKPDFLLLICFLVVLNADKDVKELTILLLGNIGAMSESLPEDLMVLKDANLTS